MSFLSTNQSQLDQFRANGNNDMLSELASLYLSETAEQISALSGQQDGESIARIAHQLKGSSANLGARLLADAFSRLEGKAKSGEPMPDSELLKEIQGTFDRTQVKLTALLNA